MRGRTNLGLYSGVAINANAAECQIAGSDSIIAGDFVKVYNEITGGLSLEKSYSRIEELSDGRYIMLKSSTVTEQSCFLQIISKNGNAFSKDITPTSIYRYFDFIPLGNDDFLCIGIGEATVTSSGSTKNVDDKLKFNFIHVDVDTNAITQKEILISQRLETITTSSSIPSPADYEGFCKYVKNGNKLYLLVNHDFFSRYQSTNYYGCYFYLYTLTISGTSLTDYDIVKDSFVKLFGSYSRTDYFAFKDSSSIALSDGIFCITIAYGTTNTANSSHIYTWDGTSSAMLSDVTDVRQRVIYSNDGDFYFFEPLDYKIRAASVDTTNNTLVFYDPQDIINVELSGNISTNLTLIRNNEDSVLLMASVNAGSSKYRYLISINLSTRLIDLRQYTLSQDSDLSYDAYMVDDNEFISLGDGKIRDVFILSNYSITTEILNILKVIKPDSTAFLLGVAKTPGDPGDIIEVYIPS